MKLPRLYHLGKNKALYFWDIFTEGDLIHSDTGQVNGQSVHSIVKAIGKNIGKINETTAEMQADKEATAKHKLKLDRKYSLSAEKAVETQQISPMLAQDYFKRINKDVRFPCDVQKKLDGMRFLAMWEDDHVVLVSRGNKKITAPKHIIKELEEILPKDAVLDGEGFTEGVGFQTLMSWCKREQPEGINLNYFCYDILLNEDDASIWSERKINLENFFKKNYHLKYVKHVKHVESITVNNHEEVMAEHAKAVTLGYEGLIVRNLDGVYQSGFRSYNLLKVKSFDDDEFLTIGIERGKGKFSDVGIFLCQTKDGKQFKAVPKATQEVKESYLKNSEQWIGKMATIAYFGLSDTGIPRFPVLQGFSLDRND